MWNYTGSLDPGMFKNKFTSCKWQKSFCFGISPLIFVPVFWEAVYWTKVHNKTTNDRAFNELTRSQAKGNRHFGKTVVRVSQHLSSFVRFLVERLPTRTEECRQLGVRKESILHCGCVNQPPQNTVVSDVLSSSPPNRNRLFWSMAFLTRAISSAPNQTSFQLCDGNSPLGPREVVEEGKDLLQACCVVSDLCCNTTVVRFDEFGETHSANERCVVSLLVIRLHCESGLKLWFLYGRKHETNKERAILKHSWI